MRNGKSLKGLWLLWVALCVALGTAVIGCGPGQRVATPADLERLGTRSYSGRSSDEVSQATVTALKLLGYDVVTTTPRIRTSPKPVAVSAFGGQGSAQAYTESVAWDIEIQDGAAGATLHAKPHASVNGQAMDQVFYDWAERTFNELMKEIDDNLSAKKSAAS